MTSSLDIQKPEERVRPGTGSVRRWTRSSYIGSSTMAVGVIVLAALPYMVAVADLYAMIDLFILLILAAMWNLLAGYGGMVSIGQQAFIGLGAYSLVVLADTLGLNVFLAVPAAAIVSAVVAVPMSYLAFRLVGGYFAIGTWVISEVVRLVVVQIPQVGGGSGLSLGALSGVDRVLRIAYTYWAALAVAVAVVLVCVFLVRSRAGMALTAVRDDPIAASTSGVYVTQTKRLVFVIAAAGCGAAGSLIALSTLRVQPDSVFSVQWSVFMIFMVIVGGLGTLEGPIIGVVVFWVLKQTLADFGPLYLILLGVVGIFFVLFVRNGVWGLVSRKRRIYLFPIGYQVTGLAGSRQSLLKKGPYL